ncbi:MAG: hypothetical protein U0231_16190 [Nitrospiraceae bacterium]
MSAIISLTCGTLFNKLDYVGGIMNNNNYQANILGGNGPKVGYGRLRYFFTDISFVSMTVLGGEQQWSAPSSTAAARAPSIATTRCALWPRAGCRGS